MKLFSLVIVLSLFAKTSSAQQDFEGKVVYTHSYQWSDKKDNSIKKDSRNIAVYFKGAKVKSVVKESDGTEYCFIQDESRQLSITAFSTLKIYTVSEIQPDASTLPDSFFIPVADSDMLYSGYQFKAYKLSTCESAYPKKLNTCDEFIWFADSIFINKKISGALNAWMPAISWNKKLMVGAINIYDADWFHSVSQFKIIELQSAPLPDDVFNLPGGYTELPFNDFTQRINTYKDAALKKQ